jgi:hypothetical protein
LILYFSNNRLKTEKLRELANENEKLKTEKSQLEETLKNLTSTNKNLHKELAKEKKEKQFFSEQLQIIKQQNLQVEINTKHNQLANLITQLKSRPNVNNFHYAIDNLLESCSELVKSNSSFAQTLFARSKQELLNSQQITEQEINIICQLQAELIRLEIQSGQLTARIEINPYLNS